MVWSKFKQGIITSLREYQSDSIYHYSRVSKQLKTSSMSGSLSPHKREKKDLGSLEIRKYQENLKSSMNCL